VFAFRSGGCTEKAREEEPVEALNISTDFLRQKGHVQKRSQKSTPKKPKTRFEQTTKNTKRNEIKAKSGNQAYKLGSVFLWACVCVCRQPQEKSRPPRLFSPPFTYSFAMLISFALYSYSMTLSNVSQGLAKGGI